MDAKVKKAWVEALRSGKYQQGRNKLAKRRAHGKTEYCCLGVLCDITGAKRRVLHDGYTGSTEITFDGEYAYLSEAQLEKFGMQRPQMTKLAQLNDEDGADFNQIADYIEEKL